MATLTPEQSYITKAGAVYCKHCGEVAKYRSKIHESYHQDVWYECCCKTAIKVAEVSDQLYHLENSKKAFEKVLEDNLNVEHQTIKTFRLEEALLEVGKGFGISEDKLNKCVNLLKEG